MERTSKGTDTKFASSAMGPCSSGRARKTTATDSAADMPMYSSKKVQVLSATGSGQHRLLDRRFCHCAPAHRAMGIARWRSLSRTTMRGSLASLLG